jgi:hypothetical protein
MVDGLITSILLHFTLNTFQERGMRPIAVAFLLTCFTLQGAMVADQTCKAQAADKNLRELHTTAS